MILVTGGTGFVGQALIRHLVEDGLKVRTLLRPSKETPSLPAGISVDIAISEISDERSLRTAMIGVDVIYHLVGAEWQGVGADLHQIEVEGTRTLIKVAKEAGVKRIVYLSHLGADRASAYPVLKVKGIVEEVIRQSEMEHTIIRSSLVYGPGDHFTTALAKVLSYFPFLFFLPEEGLNYIQPIWVEDLATVLAWSLERPESIDQSYEIGGAEFLTLRQIIEQINQKIGLRRYLIGIPPSYLRIILVILEYWFSETPLSIYWLDYFATGKTCEIDAVPRLFGLLPGRFANHLDHLEGYSWKSLAREEFKRKRQS